LKLWSRERTNWSSSAFTSDEISPRPGGRFKRCRI
jgi:hypothetical protein